MLWVYSQYKYFHIYNSADSQKSESDVCRRQILTKVNPHTVELKYL